MKLSVVLGRLLAIVFVTALPARHILAEEPATRRVEVRGVAQAMPVEGVVEAVRQATVAAQVAGRILEVKAEAGQRVAKGQALARVDARESTEAVAAAKAALVAARSNFERTEKLVTQKFLSPAALDKARADRDVAEAQVSAAQAGNSHSAIVSPMAGVVATKHAEAGDMATPGKPLLTIYEPGQLRVVAQVAQARLPELHAAKRVAVEFPEFGETLQLTSFQILPTVDPATHTVEVRIALPASKTHLLPGMAARIAFEGVEAKRLTVPIQALVRRGELAAVYVVRDGARRYELRQVRLGEKQGNGEIEVLAGLAGGETIALDPLLAGTHRRPAAAQ
jgi:RND family efflux transporter MFP subunit